MGGGMEYNVTELKGSSKGSPLVEVVNTQPTQANLTCNPDLIPTFKDYYSGIELSTGLPVFSLGILAVIIIITLYFETVCHILKYGISSTKTNSIFVLSIYPVVAVASCCVIFVPRSQIISEAIIQIMFMTCLYQLFCLFVTYCNGDSGLMEKLPAKALNLRVAPCCCWPCCFCLQEVTLTKERLNYLRMLVLQLPIVQGLCYLVQLIMWAEEQIIYQINYIYIQPVVIASILIGVWGMVMTVHMLVPVLKNHSLFAKFFLLQLVLVLTKFQTMFAKIPIWIGIFECKYPMSPILYSNMIYNFILLWEMAFLTFLARIFYKKPVPESYSTSVRVSNLPKKITSLSDNIAKFEVFKENNNKSV